MLIAGGWPLLLTYHSVWSSQRIPVVMPLDLHAPPATVGAPDAPPDHAVVRAAPVVSPADGPLPDDAEGRFSRAVALLAPGVQHVDQSVRRSAAFPSGTGIPRRHLGEGVWQSRGRVWPEKTTCPPTIELKRGQRGRPGFYDVFRVFRLPRERLMRVLSDTPACIPGSMKAPGLPYLFSPERCPYGHGGSGRLPGRGLGRSGRLCGLGRGGLGGGHGDAAAGFGGLEPCPE